MLRPSLIIYLLRSLSLPLTLPWMHYYSHYSISMDMLKNIHIICILGCCIIRSSLSSRVSHRFGRKSCHTAGHRLRYESLGSSERVSRNFVFLILTVMLQLIVINTFKVVAFSANIVCSCYYLRLFTFWSTMAVKSIMSNSRKTSSRWAKSLDFGHCLFLWSCLWLIQSTIKYKMP